MGRHETRERRTHRIDPWGSDDGPARTGAPEPVAEFVDRTPPRPQRSWRDLPRPSRSALLGVAVLALVAGGAVHLSTAGTALPEDPVVVTGQGAESSTPVPAEPTASTAPSAPAASDGATPATANGGAPVVVHVTGAVASPGVVELPAGSRVDDAVSAAGGATADADLAAVNLARPAVDGEQIHVPVPGEEPVVAPPGPQPGGTTPSGSGTATGTAAGGAVDINTADAAALDTLPGVGPAIAQRIVEHREANGPFRSVDDLQDVPGIGPATLEKIRAKATV